MSTSVPLGGEPTACEHLRWLRWPLPPGQSESESFPPGTSQKKAQVLWLSLFMKQSKQSDTNRERHRNANKRDRGRHDRQGNCTHPLPAMQTPSRAAIFPVPVPRPTSPAQPSGPAQRNPTQLNPPTVCTLNHRSNCRHHRYSCTERARVRTAEATKLWVNTISFQDEDVEGPRHRGKKKGPHGAAAYRGTAA